MDAELQNEIYYALSDLHDIIGQLVNWPYPTCEEFDTKTNICYTCRSRRACELNREFIQHLNRIKQL